MDASEIEAFKAKAEKLNSIEYRIRILKDNINKLNIAAAYDTKSSTAIYVTAKSGQNSLKSYVINQLSIPVEMCKFLNMNLISFFEQEIRDLEKELEEL